MTEAEPTTGVPRWRHWLPWALVALAALVLLASSLTVWVKRQALSTDAWATASGELIQDPATRAAVSSYLVEEAFAGTDVPGRLTQALPPRLEPLAPALTAALGDVARRTAAEIMARPRFQELWVDANRRAHRTFLDVVDERSGTVTSEGTTVILDLRPLVDQLAGRLGVADRLPPDAGRLRIADAEKLEQVKAGVRALRVVSQLLVLLVVALLAAAVWLAPGRRRAVLMAAGGAMVLVGLALMLVRRAAGAYVVEALADEPANRPVADHAWLVGTSLMRDVAVATIGYGLLVLLAAWLAGMSRYAVAARRWAAPRLRAAPWAAAGVAAAIGLALLAWGPGSGGDRRLLGVLVGIGLFAVAVGVLWRQALREFPETPPSRAAPY